MMYLTLPARSRTLVTSATNTANFIRENSSTFEMYLSENAL
jgi:hypothetical protein